MFFEEDAKLLQAKNYFRFLFVIISIIIILFAATRQLLPRLCSMGMAGTIRA